MADLDPMGHWLLLGVVAWISFMIGRATAKLGGGVSPERRMADQQQIASATADLSPSVWADIDRLLSEKKKIEAIKVLREASGLGLKLSKDAVEQRAALR